MPTRTLTLKHDASTKVYYTRWTDDSGKRHKTCFGSSKTPARIFFAEFHAKWIADPSVRNPKQRDAPNTIGQVVELFQQHAEKYYRRKDGTPTREHVNFQHATRELVEMFGELRAEDFGIHKIKKVRAQMIKNGLARQTINARIRRIRHVIRWAYREGMLSLKVLSKVESLPALKAFRSAAKETKSVIPVADHLIHATLQHCPMMLSAMIMVQRLTGMRPGELTIMRPCDIDMSGRVWLYKPSQHKLSHMDKDRIIGIGPKAQKWITPLLTHDLIAYLFNPRRSRGERESKGRERPRKTDRRVRDHYDVQSYYRAICYACDKAGVSRWSPNQLRHAWATEARKQQTGLDHVQVQLGHSDIKTTQIYAKAADESAVEYIRKHG